MCKIPCLQLQSALFEYPTLEIITRIRICDFNDEKSRFGRQTRRFALQHECSRFGDTCNRRTGILL